MSLLSGNPALQALYDAAVEDLVHCEGLAPEAIAAAIDAGTMVLLGNPNHADVYPTLIGRPASIKVNANIGASPFRCDPDKEMEKLKAAEAAGAHAVMDLSTGGDLDSIRQEMLATSRLPLGTVPLYGLAKRCADADADPADFTIEEFLAEIENQAAQGVDFMTLHVGVTRRAVQMADEAQRVLGIVSRGGSITARWMRERGEENPLLTRWDDVLDICKPLNVTLSLGDGMRPGAGADAGDAAQWDEVGTLAQAARRARQAGCQAMIEGPGHVPMHLVDGHIRTMKRMVDHAPLYVLGPLVTDSAPGYDHIAAAIGGAIAAHAGADFLCYVTPAEHLTLPDADDVRQGVMASRVAAQAAEVSLGVPHAVARDLAVSRARRALDWEAMTARVLDRDIVGERRAEHSKEKECAMCGRFCAIKMLDDSL